ILDKVESYKPDFDEELLQKAYIFSAREHRGQMRSSGDPYLIHPLNVAYILAEMHLDETSIAVGLLHDVLEDTLTTKETLEEVFGHDIAELVDGVTKISRYAYVSKEEQQAETFRKMLLAMVSDLRVVLVKLARQEIDAGQLYDYLAFRIVTPSVKDCYAALGIIHQMWRPVPGRIKDYIAMPKPNFYQSLHTTVVAEKGQPFEVQIRTREMDLIAEQGIAAHWKYKEGRVGAQPDDTNFLWLRQLVEWQHEITDPRDFMHSLKI